MAMFVAILAVPACGDAGTETRAPAAASEPSGVLVAPTGSVAATSAPIGHSTPGPDEYAAMRCRDIAVPHAQESGEAAALVASHAATIADLVEWEETPSEDGGPYVEESFYRSGFNQDEVIAYCYVDGLFSGIPGADRRGGYTRLGILVLKSDMAVTIRAGDAEGLPVDFAPSL